MFGKVLEGADVIKECEKVGSQSGKTSKDVVIADCKQAPLHATRSHNHPPDHPPVHATGGQL